MKIFLDTADVEQVASCMRQGCIDGVTTNPSLVAKVGGNYHDLLRTICQLVGHDRPVSAEVLATDFDGMVGEARVLRNIAPNVVVKIPVIGRPEAYDAMRAVASCTQEGIPTNVTLCFSVSQAVLAAKAGAAYISPFVGRIDDVGGDGMALIADILTAYRHYAFTTKVLVASVRSMEHVTKAMTLGAHAATVPFTIAQQLLHHDLTEKGLDRFLEDSARIAR